ncbi:DUF881 domain-containing protein [Carbonactinospora thermoautotrophica]|nr:DUF881 domain-containing protein [Carbonactinospora thermoautotrophica]
MNEQQETPETTTRPDRSGTHRKPPKRVLPPPAGDQDEPAGRAGTSPRPGALALRGGTPAPAPAQPAGTSEPPSREDVSATADTVPAGLRITGAGQPPDDEPSPAGEPPADPGAARPSPAARPESAVGGPGGAAPGPDHAGADGRTPGERLRAAFFRPGRGQLVAAVLLALLGFALAVQVRANTAESQLQVARQSDLVRILDDVTDRTERLEEEARRLERQRDELLTGTNQEKAALEQAREKERVLGILAGTVRAEGQGIILEIQDPEGKVTAEALLDALQELRDAGAEAVQINSVRVVANTEFVNGGPGRVLVGGQQVSPPYTFKVIGDAATLASALEIPGGVRETLKEKGAQTEVKQMTNVTVDAVLPLRENRYAKPSRDS